MSERVSLIVLLWALLAGLLYLCRRCSPLHSLVVVAIATGVLGAFHPLLSLWVEPLTWRHAAWTPEEVLLGVQREYASFATGLLAVGALAWVPGWLSPHRERVGSRARLARHPVLGLARRDLLISGGLVTIGAGLYGAYVAQVGFEALGDRADFGRKYLASEGLGVLSAGLFLMMAGCLWGEQSPISRRARWLFRALATSVVVWSLLVMSMRSNVLALALGYLWIHCRRRDVRLLRPRPALLGLLALSYAGMEAFSVVRGIWHHGASSTWQTLSGDPRLSLASLVGGSELAHPFLTTLEVVETRTPGELGGASYADAIPALVPRFLHPERPETLSESFVHTNYAQYAELGGGTGFSLVAEAWLNFGAILGPLLAGMVIAALLLLVEVGASATPQGILSRLAPNLPYLAAVAHRAESASLLKHAVGILLPVLACWLAAGFLARVAGRGHSLALVSAARRG